MTITASNHAELNAKMNQDDNAKNNELYLHTNYDSLDEGNQSKTFGMFVKLEVKSTENE